MTFLRYQMNFFVIFVPPAFACFYITRNYLKKNIFIITLLPCVISLICGTGIYFLSFLDAYVSDDFFNLMIILLSSIPVAVLYFYYCRVTKLEKEILLFITLIMANYASMNAVLSLGLEYYFFYEYYYGDYTWTGILCTILLHLCLLPTVIWLVTQKMLPVVMLLNPLHSKSIWGIPLIFIFVSAILAVSYEAEMIRSWQYTLITALLAICFFLTYYLIGQTLIHVDRTARYEKQLDLIDRELSIQASRFDQVTAHIEQLRRLRHDVRHHISVVRQMLAASRYEQCEQYLQEYFYSTEQNTKQMFYCSHHIINTLSAHYAELARAQNIQIDYKLDISQDICISNTDLCIVFGNLVENAIEACSLVKNAPQEITVTAKYKNNKLIIHTQNTFDGTVHKTPHGFYSRKRNLVYGTGIRSIEAVAQKYNGITEFEHDDHIFLVKIVLFDNDLR